MKSKRACAHAREAASWVYECVAIPLLCGVCLCVWCAFALITRKTMVCGTRRKQTRYYTEKEWMELKQKPKPQIVHPWDDTQFINVDDVESDQQRSAADNPKVIAPTTTSDPYLATANKRQPFRFLDLPKDIQLMVLGMLVLGHKDNHWVARANYCKDGFHFCRKPAYVDHVDGRRLKCKSHDPVLVTKNKYLVCPTNHSVTTRSLLLTSKTIRELTEQTRGLSFSGTLRFEGPEPGSQLGEGWGWYGLTLGSPILTSHTWFLKRVRVLETPHYREIWMDAPRIMPSLEHIKLTPGLAARLLALDPRGRELDGQQDDFHRRFSEGEFDQQVTQNSIEIGRKWVGLVEPLAASGDRVVKVSVFMKYHLSGAWQNSNQLPDVRRLPLPQAIHHEPLLT